MNGVLVTGTDTGVGKTVVCGHLARFLRGEGMRVTTQKWVETGCPGASRDLAVHRRIMGDEDDAPAGDRSVYTFKVPASPHLAASRAETRIDPDRIEAAYRRLAASHDVVLAEGAGGALVPLGGALLVADLAARLSMTALVVAENRLGAINHVLLTIEALASRRIPIVGVIFNRSRAARLPVTGIARDNMETVASLGRVPVLGEFAHQPDPYRAAKAFAPVGRAFLARLEEMESV